MTWKEAIDGLQDQIQKWVDEAPKEFSISARNEEAPAKGKPVLEISANGHEWANHITVLLEPSEFAPESVPAEMHLYSYPRMSLAVLHGPDSSGAWEVESRDGIPLHVNWDKNGFVGLLRDLT